MDFPLLLPQVQGIVLEVNGSQHYTSPSGQGPDSVKYPPAVAWARVLKLG